MDEEKDLSNETKKNNSIQRIAQGTFLVLVASIISIIFTFFGRFLIIRFWSQSDYGVFSLALAILIVLTLIGSLGLREGVIRNIAYSREKKEGKKILDLISSSILLSVIAGILLGMALFVFSDFIAVNIFHKFQLAAPLKIFAFGIPIFNLIHIVVSIYRGFDKVKPLIYFKQILINVLFPVFVIIIIIFHLPFINLFYAYLLSIIITCFLLFLYSIKRVNFLQLLSLKSITSSPAKELVIFSLPLLGTTILIDVLIWADTFMIGIFKTADDVGLYNAANPLARFITFPLISFSIIFIPIASGLYAQGKLEEIKRNFLILTKWLCLSTMPLFFIMFLYPTEIITTLFGVKYVGAAIALRILSIGYIIRILSGLNYSPLIAAGKTRFILFSFLIAGAINIILNATLIPTYGIDGAAFASLASILSVNLIKEYKIYKLFRAQPLSKNLIKPIIFSLIVILVIHFILSSFVTFNIWIIAVIFISYYLIFGLGTLLTKSFDQEDLDILQSIEKRTGFKSKIIKKVFYRFL